MPKCIPKNKNLRKFNAKPYTMYALRASQFGNAITSIFTYDGNNKKSPPSNIIIVNIIL